MATDISCRDQASH